MVLKTKREKQAFFLGLNKNKATSKRRTAKKSTNYNQTYRQRRYKTRSRSRRYYR